MRDCSSVATSSLLILSLISALSLSAQAQPQRFALVVGVKEYTASEKLNKLPYAEEDAAKLGEVLEQIGYDVTLMTQKASEGENRRRFAPTATQLRKEFETLVKTPFLKKTDCIVVTLAGHGIQLPSKDDPKKTAYFFCPEDARIDDLTYAEEVADKHNLISVEEFYANLQNCQAGVRLLVVDACRNDPNQPGAFRSTNSITRPPVSAPPGGIAALFSCSANERAVEDANLKHGVFSHFLIEALSGQADTDQDKELTIAEIQSYVGQRTFNFVRKNYGRQQLPELSGTIQGWAALGTLAPGKPMVNPPLEIPPLATFAGSKAGEVWDQNGLKMKFCWCPPGQFTMGSPTSEPGRGQYETQVSVTLTRGFWLGQYEVTQAEWETVMDTTPWDSVKNVRAGDKYPACGMTWDEAHEFCRKLTAMGRAEKWLPQDWQFELPTEAQWEYACRAGTESRYYFGTDDAQLSDHAWWGGLYGQGNTADEQYPHPVGLKKANPWNCYDLYGNVWEWCLDRYVEKHPGGTDPLVSAEGEHRVARGGGWSELLSSCRSAHRYRIGSDFRASSRGTRVALIPAPGKPGKPAMEHEPLATFEGRQAGDVWEENSLKLKFSWCPPGKFTMGSPASQTGRWENEGQVSVTLTQGFWLARHEVTQADWTRIMGSSPWSGQEHSIEGARHPAAWMKLDDASRFCQKLTELGRTEGWLPNDWKFDLPTEAQWEYACRAGTTTRFSFGDDDGRLSEYGWWGGFEGEGNTAGDPHSQPVGLKKPNPWGLYDMHGNINEYCRDWYAEQLPGGTDPEVRSGVERVIKGGGWAFQTSFSRSAMRINLRPETGYFDVGLRVAIVPAAPGRPPLKNEPLNDF